MNDNHRVFITGVSALTASGESAQTTWDAILEGKSGLGDIKNDDLSTWAAHLGGELKQFNPARLLPDRKLLKVISRQDVMGIYAAMQAVEHSQLITYRDQLSDPTSFNEQTAIYVGSPGNKYFQQYDFLPLIAKANDDMQAFAGELFNEVHPMWLLRILPNNVLAYTGITYGFKGPNHNISNHAVGGTQAIIEAYHAIKYGQTDRAVVVAYDIGLETQALFYYDKLGVISHQHLKPFDKAHDGTLLGEGAAAIILENETSALERHATCYGEILGGLSGSEGEGLFSVEKTGASLSQLIQQLLDNLQLSPTDLDFIVAHGNGNKKSDETEAYAIETVFNKNTIPVTGFKWSVGHTLAASGLIDTVLTTYALNNRCIPGIAPFSKPAQTCEGLNLSPTHRQLSSHQQTALMINRGFGSMNACLVIKSCA